MYDHEKMHAKRQAAEMDSPVRQPEVLEQLNELHAATEYAHTAMLELCRRLASVAREENEVCTDTSSAAQRNLVPLANELRVASQKANQTAALAVDLMSRLEV